MDIGKENNGCAGVNGGGKGEIKRIRRLESEKRDKDPIPGRPAGDKTGLPSISVAGIGPGQRRPRAGR